VVARHMPAVTLATVPATISTILHSTTHSLRGISPLILVQVLLTLGLEYLTWTSKRNWLVAMTA
jgi:hypothetical protein